MVDEECSCRDLSVSAPECTEDMDCGSVVSTPFFMTFLMINSSIVLSMCIAVVLSNFGWIYATEQVLKKGRINDTNQISAHHLRKAREAWDELDRRGTGYILYTDLKPFLMQCGPPLGFLDPTAWQLSQTIVQVQAFPMSRAGFCRFHDLVTVRICAIMGSEAVDKEHIAATIGITNPIMKFRNAIRMVSQRERQTYRQ